MAKTPIATKETTISGLTFEISQPYVEGEFTLSAGEAAVLNQTRRENIGNSVRKALDALKAEDGSITAENIEKASALVAEKNETYEFTVGSVGTSRVTDPLERECMALAQSVVLNNLKGASTTVKAYKEAEGGEEKYNALVAQVMEMPEVKTAAKANLAARSGLTDIKLG